MLTAPVIVYHVLGVDENDNMFSETRVHMPEGMDASKLPEGWEEKRIGTARMAACNGTDAQCSPCAIGLGCNVPDLPPHSWCNGGYWAPQDNPNADEAGGGAGYPITNYHNIGVQDAIDAASTPAGQGINLNLGDTYLGALLSTNTRHVTQPFHSGTSACGGWDYDVVWYGGQNLRTHFPKCSIIESASGKGLCGGTWPNVNQKPRANDIVFFKGQVAGSEQLPGGVLPVGAGCNSPFGRAFACTAVHYIAEHKNFDLDGHPSTYYPPFTWTNSFGTHAYRVMAGAALIIDKNWIDSWAIQRGWTSAQRAGLHRMVACHEIGHTVGLLHGDGDGQLSCMDHPNPLRPDTLYFNYSPKEINEINDNSATLRPPRFGQER